MPPAATLHSPEDHLGELLVLRLQELQVTAKVSVSVEVTETTCFASRAALESMNHPSTMGLMSLSGISFQNDVCPNLGFRQLFPVL